MSPVVDVTLGHAVAALYGPWKGTVGDSLIDPKTGKPLWAEPDFDDSGWEYIERTPKRGVANANRWESRYCQPSLDAHFSLPIRLAGRRPLWWMCD